MHSKLSYLSELKPHKKIKIIKSALSKVSVWIYWMYNCICVLDISAHDDQGCTGIEPAPL